MDATPESDAELRIAELREQAERLIGSARAPVRRVRLSAGDTTMEVEWADSAAHDGRPPDSRPVDAPTPGEPAEPTDAFTVPAPLVGTFYRAPEPGSPPYVQVGDVVETGQQLAIVEAMKLMNPVLAERPGRVVEIPVNDAVPVEYGEVLFVLENG